MTYFGSKSRWKFRKSRLFIEQMIHVAHGEQGPKGRHNFDGPLERQRGPAFDPFRREGWDAAAR
jgi:hypothetical protein